MTTATDASLNPFDPLGREDWEKRATADLKGASVQSLDTTLLDGVVVRALYTREDYTPVSARGEAGASPYVRGTRTEGGWLIRQEYSDPRLDETRAQIEEDLQRGVDAIWLCAGLHQGCRLLRHHELNELIRNVDLERVSIYFEPGPDPIPLAVAYAKVARDRGVDLKKVRGCFGADPISSLLVDGVVVAGLRAKARGWSDLAAWARDNMPGMRTAMVSGHPMSEAGCTTVQELGWTISAGLMYLRQLIASGFTPDDAAKQIAFAYSIGGDFFTEIAKLRAARLLWSTALRHSGVSAENCGMEMHCRTSLFTKTSVDPWVNMLRATSEAAAAALGGADSIATLPFDVAVGPSDALARRVARNTQIVLRDEAQISRVVDAPGGSWYVESLTDSLARAGWEELQSVEKQGGFEAALVAGHFATAAEQARGKRHELISTRETAIVGVNEFPMLDEKLLQRAPVDQARVEQKLEEAFAKLEPASFRDKLVALADLAIRPKLEPGRLTIGALAAIDAGADLLSIGAVLRHGHPDVHVEPLREWRASMVWEHQRELSAAWRRHAGMLPTVFAATVGSLASYNTRLTWTTNLLAASGIDVKRGVGGADPAAIAREWKASGQLLPLICGSDRDYDQLLSKVVAALAELGARQVLIAGSPREITPPGKVEIAFLHHGQDALDATKRVHQWLGVVDD